MIVLSEGCGHVSGSVVCSQIRVRALLGSLAGHVPHPPRPGVPSAPRILPIRATGSRLRRRHISSRHHKQTPQTNKPATMKSPFALATLALLAGQTAAADTCHLLSSDPSGTFEASSCQPAGRNRWACGDGATVWRTGSTLSFHTGSRTAYISVGGCGGESTRLFCPAHVWGSATVPCAGQLSISYLAQKQ